MTCRFFAALSLILGISATAVFGADAGAFSWEANAEFSAVGEANFRRSSDIGDVDSFDKEFRAVASYQAKPGFLIRFGFELQRFDFGLPQDAPLPSNLESVGLVIGGDFQIGDAWLVRLDLHPGFYTGSDQFNGDDFNIPVTLGGSYFVNADLQLVVGLSVDTYRKYPVLPAAGVRWRFAKDWVLDAILPTPRVEYNFTQSLTLYVGGDFRGETYRMDGAFGSSHGLPKLDNALVDYTQIRVGGGASWKIDPHFSVELEAGCVPVHDFDFHRADIGVRSQEVPPYARIGLQAEF